MRRKRPLLALLALLAGRAICAVPETMLTTRVVPMSVHPRRHRERSRADEITPQARDKKVGVRCPLLSWPVLTRCAGDGVGIGCACQQSIEATN
jgi:hypothetical protein